MLELHGGQFCVLESSRGKVPFATEAESDFVVGRFADLWGGSAGVRHDAKLLVTAASESSKERFPMP